MENNKTYREKIQAFMEKSAKEKLKIMTPYAISSFACDRIVELYRLCDGNLTKVIKNMEYLYKSFPDFVLSDLAIGTAVGCMIVAYVKFENSMHRKNTRQGEEYGASRWGTADDIKPFIDPDPFYNIILSKTEFLSMNPRMKKFNLNRNKHVVVYGGSGSGKTYGIVKANLYQLHSSYVLTDPNR